jgi:hypothetical protein
MKITIHITFFYLPDRVVYINKIIDETNNYGCTADIHLHTNEPTLNETAFNKYTNGRLQIIHHDLSNMNPFYLTWLCRDLMKQQQHEYDAFMYIEDDILVPYKAIQYWVNYNEKLINLNYNLGFVRIEVADNTEYITDIRRKHFDTYIRLDETYCVNNVNPYCAFWIYNKQEFNKFVKSKYYDINNIPNYHIREKSAIGLHGNGTNWYKGTVIPLRNNTLTPDCRIYHMPNNYVGGRKGFASIKFEEALRGAL